ncbi:hypothetical protein DP113_20315 [Brasilonema octagenarum UFV-E1]|uniref:Uncharacterized protein n=2 Tax=Brasilonema TaxID=383614 RepID=A0A856MGV0_9CYAN|nr:hypothetical protein [Brasilonema octagenarum UFV-OR1]QDL09928.1 hypothetical protein DP114_20390 [Brasilonema sennae CENA114]QDL16280.1 hypothetical protein DP113_20315 [Brasilonema octagenarum UFV-E1]
MQVGIFREIDELIWEHPKCVSYIGIRFDLVNYKVERGNREQGTGNREQGTGKKNVQIHK